MSKEPTSKESTSKERIYLSPPHMSGKEQEYVRQAFESNWIAPVGKNIDRFEEELAAHAGVQSAAVLTSGTAAIHLALILMGIKRGDEVLCQSFTFSASANPIRYLGAEPIFIDSEPGSWNMDPELLERAIRDSMKAGRQPAAIVVVHLYGMPARMDKILEIATGYDIPVLEDAAEAVGSSMSGFQCGSFGDMGVFSFNGNKIITGSGGGALLSDDEALIDEARFLATQARDPAPHYEHSRIGYNYRMSNVVAGIGRGQLEVIGARVEARRYNHEAYFKALGGAWLEVAIHSDADQDPEDTDPSTKIGQMHLQKSVTGRKVRPRVTFGEGSTSPTGIYFLKEPENCRSNRWLTTILVNPDETGGVNREDIRMALEEENIESRPLWKPMHLQPVFDESKAYTNGLSEFLFDHGLCLPSGSSLSAADRERIIGVIRSVI